MASTRPLPHEQPTKRLPSDYRILDYMAEHREHWDTLRSILNDEQVCPTREAQLLHQYPSFARYYGQP